MDAGECSAVTAVCYSSVSHVTDSLCARTRKLPREKRVSFREIEALQFTDVETEARNAEVPGPWNRSLRGICKLLPEPKPTGGLRRCPGQTSEEGQIHA